MFKKHKILLIKNNIFTKSIFFGNDFFININSKMIVN